MRNRNRWLFFGGFLMVLAGAILPFLIIVDILPSTFFTNFIAYFVSVAGLFLGTYASVNVWLERKWQNDSEQW